MSDETQMKNTAFCLPNLFMYVLSSIWENYFPMTLGPGSASFPTWKLYVPAALERSIALQEAENFFSLYHPPHTNQSWEEMRA